MKKFFRFYLTTIILFINNSLFSQENLDMANTMRSNGKIYVVVGVIGIIFLGIIFYLIRLDLKISRLEKIKKTINQ
ncbi:MAG: CcmD family protein [Bacteroidota bacterium]|jgi:hypothetical protein